MAFTNYLEDENDKPYFNKNSLAYYYDKMEGFAKAVEGSAKALNLTKEEVEKRITLYIEQNKNELDQRFAKNKNELDQRLALWDGKLETFDSSVETLLSEWVDDGTLTHVIDSTLIDQKIEPLALQLGETAKQVDVEEAMKIAQGKMPTLPISKLSKIKKLIAVPDLFSWKTAPIKIYRDGVGNVTTDLNPSSFKPLGGLTYYVSKTGSDSNDGLSSATALRNIHTARAKADVTTIIVGGGTYEDTDGFNGSGLPVKPLAIIGAIGEDVIISTARDLTWSKTEGFTNVYRASRTVVASVYDAGFLNEQGDYSKLKSVSSIEAVDSTPGSYHYVSPNLYVHTVDSRPADTNVKAFLDIINFRNIGNVVTYMENIKLYGGNNGAIAVGADTSTDTPLLVAKNCEFKYSTNGSGGVVSTGADTILQSCVCSSNSKDGFNYHHANGRKVNSIEVDCRGYLNGIGRTDAQDNGSTTHDGCKIIRVNGKYHNNAGPNVHDINISTESWNISTESFDSASPASAKNTCYMVEDKAKMFLDSAIGYDSNRTIYISADSSLYIRNSLFDDGEAKIIEGGVYKAY